MTELFPSLGDSPSVPDILKLNPRTGRAILEMNEAIMRGLSTLTPGERELVAAYVSALNECQYCHGVHAAAARAFGMPADAIAGMVANLETAPISPKLKPLLRFARKLTLAPTSVDASDAQSVIAEGWNEKALHDLTMVVCCFNFMNRLLEAHGVKGHQAQFDQRGPMLKEHGYLPLLRLLPLEEENSS